MTEEELSLWYAVDYDAVDWAEVCCLEDIRLEPAIPLEDRVCALLGQGGNPYCLRCGQTPVRLCFSPEGARLDEKLRDYFLRRKQ